MKFLAFLHCSDFKSNYSHMLGPYNLNTSKEIFWSVYPVQSHQKLKHQQLNKPFKVLWKFKI